MIENSARVHWAGPGKKGQCQISTESGALERHPCGFSSRFEEDGLDTDTKTRVRLAKEDEGFVTDRIALTLNAVVPVINDARFQHIALATKRECPPPKALACVAEISLHATLETAEA